MGVPNRCNDMQRAFVRRTATIVADCSRITNYGESNYPIIVYYPIMVNPIIQLSSITNYGESNYPIIVYRYSPNIPKLSSQNMSESKQMVIFFMNLPLDSGRPTISWPLPSRSWMNLKAHYPRSWAVSAGKL